MPNKTIYVADADVPLYDEAQALAGGNLSSAIAQALQRYVAEAGQQGGDIVVPVSEQGMTVRKRFRGNLLAEQRASSVDKTKLTVYRVYRTEKGNLAVWSKAVPNWSRADLAAMRRDLIRSDLEALRRELPRQEFAAMRKDLRHKYAEEPRGGDAGWESCELRLDVYQSLEDLQPNVPDSLYRRVRHIIETGSEIEDLDI